MAESSSQAEQAGQAGQAGSTEGKITPEGVERLRARLGVEVPQDFPAWEYASVDAFRHVAHSYGDDNPLWCDPRYAASSRYGSVIAPPPFLSLTGVSEAPPIPPELRARGAGALRGVHQFFAGASAEFIRPIVPGERLTKRYYLSDVEEKTSAFGGGRSVVERYRSEYLDQSGRLVGVHHRHFVRTEREASRKASESKEPVTLARYSEQEIEQIEAAYSQALTLRRGAETRYWEDVQVGEMIGPRVKGPLLVSDIIADMQGNGSDVMAPFELRHKYRLRHPGFFSENEFGYPDLLVRVHWDNAAATIVGNPSSYDFGRMRDHWLCHLITDWMGDDGWLRTFSAEVRRFNFIGDLSTVQGTVQRKFEQGENRCIEITLEITSQRGERTAHGSATVLLPSRDHGPVVFD